MDSPAQTDIPVLDAAPTCPVRRRRVFYVHGFDPRGAGVYHRMFAEQAALWSERHGVPLEVSGRRRAGRYQSRWTVRSGDGASVEFDYLIWDDIVRRRMSRTLGRSLADAWRLLRHLWPRGWFGRMWRADRSMGAMAWYPYFWIAAYGVAGAAAGLVPALVLLEGELALVAALGATPATVVVSYRLSRRLDAAMRVYYLVHDKGFVIEETIGQTPEMDARLDLFAEIIEEAASSADYDEVLVVAHSSGGTQAVGALARMIDARPRGPRVSFLTLGQSICLTSFLPEASRLRGELARVAASDRIDWVDVSSPRDALCFALLDPVAAPDVPDAGPRRGPKVLSAQLDKVYGPALLRRQRFDVFNRHFIYFHARELPGDWDWFAVCCGPARLADRFAARRSSGAATRMETA